MYAPGSRYAPLGTLTLAAPDGLATAYTATGRSPHERRRGAHRVTESDRPDLLGWRATGDPTRFWMVADVNAAFDPDELTSPAGRVIALPALD